ncbi:hypothetical protein QN277_009223 [Acacia crassicarpa]|uniref:Uncharacterized protein n=1 Tax=Acacia crassicarpa TaxID=499986 RepID=A0AAE1M909_9FABA|nr:hypothetical protein QN277_009223 [Acacia crassicarpa]
MLARWRPSYISTGARLERWVLGTTEGTSRATSTENLPAQARLLIEQADNMDHDNEEEDLHLMLGLLMVVVIILSDRSVEDRSDSRRKRRRTSRRDAVELLCEAMKESSKTLTQASENICKAFVEARRDSPYVKGAQQLYAELMKVEELTSDEINRAHIRIVQSRNLTIAFPSIPDEYKAGWVRNLIN